MSFSHDAIPDESSPAPECGDRGVLIVLVAAGLLPFLIALLTGAWSQREIAVGAMLLLLAFSGMLSSGPSTGTRRQPR